MKELTDLIVARMNHMTGSGRIVELIDNQLNATVTDVLKESLRSYGDFGKELKSKLEGSMGNAMGRVSFPEYSHFVGKVTTEILAAHYQDEIARSIQEQVKEIFEPVPKEMTIGELYQKIGRLIDPEQDEVEFEDGHYVNVEGILSENEDAFYLTIPTVGKLVMYDHRNEGSFYIGYIEDNRENQITVSIGGATHAMGAVGWLFKLYCAGTRITGVEHADETISVAY